MFWSGEIVGSRSRWRPERCDSGGGTHCDVLGAACVVVDRREASSVGYKHQLALRSAFPQVRLSVEPLVRPPTVMTHASVRLFSSVPKRPMRPGDDGMAGGRRRVVWGHRWAGGGRGVTASHRVGDCGSQAG